LKRAGSQIGDLGGPDLANGPYFGDPWNKMFMVQYAETFSKSLNTMAHVDLDMACNDPEFGVNVLLNGCGTHLYSGRRVSLNAVILYHCIVLFCSSSS